MTEEEAKTKWCPSVRVVGGSKDPEGNLEVDVSPAALDELCVRLGDVARFLAAGNHTNAIYAVRACAAIRELQQQSDARWREQDRLFAELEAARHHEGMKWGLCIASACMAWRWGKDAPHPNPTEQAVVMHGTSEQRAQVRAEIAGRRTGYCGLAGAPQ